MHLTLDKIGGFVFMLLGISLCAVTIVDASDGVFYSASRTGTKLVSLSDGYWWFYFNLSWQVLIGVLIAAYGFYIYRCSKVNAS